MVPSAEPALSDISDAPVDVDPGSVIVSSFVHCQCQQPAYPEKHLAIQSFTVPLQHGVAVAVSYAIGDFARAKHIIGHKVDGSDGPIMLELGGEGDVPGMMNLLANLTEEKSAIWIDQLSIRQEDEEIPKQLQRIPDIYSTLEVIVLLPNEPCKCLRESLERYQAGDQTLTTQEGDFFLDLVMNRCPLSAAISSYSSRVWTRQEFGYARMISTRFSAPTGAKCCKYVSPQVRNGFNPQLGKHHLNSYFGWLHQKGLQLAEQHEAVLHVDDAFGIASSLIRNQVQQTLRGFSGFLAEFHRNEHNDTLFSTLYRIYAEFLLGAKLQRKHEEGERFLTFVTVGAPQRATVQNDYVLSFFPAMAGYRVPQNSQTMGLLELLDDAFSQYESIKGMHWKTTLPQGLFQLGPGSSRCRPSHYLNPAKIEDFRSVYGAVLTGSVFQVNDAGSVMLQLLDHQRHPSYGSRIIRSQTYESLFGHSLTNEVLQFMRRVSRPLLVSESLRPISPLFETWAISVTRSELALPTKWPSSELGVAVFCEMLRGNAEWGDLPDIDHYDACYRILCNWVSIDPDMAKEKGLGLVVCTDEPPCIGFVNRFVYQMLRKLEEFRAVCKAQSLDPVTICQDENINNILSLQEWLSVSISSSKDDSSGGLVYEVCKVDTLERNATKLSRTDSQSFDKKESLPNYMVVGVWSPTDMEDDSVGAQTAYPWSECDGIII